MYYFAANVSMQIVQHRRQFEYLLDNSDSIHCYYHIAKSQSLSQSLMSSLQVQSVSSDTLQLVITLTGE